MLKNKDISKQEIKNKKNIYILIIYINKKKKKKKK